MIRKETVPNSYNLVRIRFNTTFTFGDGIASTCRNTSRRLNTELNDFTNSIHKRALRTV